MMSGDVSKRDSVDRRGFRVGANFGIANDYNGNTAVLGSRTIEMEAHFKFQLSRVGNLPGSLRSG